MRVFALILMILALVPTVYLRAPKPAPPSGQPMVFEDLMPALRRAGPLPAAGPLTLTGAWQLHGGFPQSATLSGLAQAGAGMVAVGDRGAVLWFTRPDRPKPDQALAGPMRLAKLINRDWRRHRHPTDAESVAGISGTDLQGTDVLGTGDLLVGYEDPPALLRFSRDLMLRARTPLPELVERTLNRGPEAMTVLADRRTVVIGESHARWFDRTTHTGLIFPGLPSPDETAQSFTVHMPPGVRPCELAQMPDGRLLVLGRSFSLAGFRSFIGVIAPADIRAGATITPNMLARIDDPRIRDNYEGMTVTREPDGSAALWLLSDSNQMVWAQRTLLLKLRFP